MTDGSDRCGLGPGDGGVTKALAGLFSVLGKMLLYSRPDAKLRAELERS